MPAGALDAVVPEGAAVDAGPAGVLAVTAESGALSGAGRAAAVAPRVRSTVSETPVAAMATTATSTTAAMRPLRDEGCGSDGVEASSAAEPSVAYERELGGTSDTRAVSLATASSPPLATGTSGSVMPSI